MELELVAPKNVELSRLSTQFQSKMTCFLFFRPNLVCHANLGAGFTCFVNFQHCLLFEIDKTGACCTKKGVDSIFTTIFK